MYVSTCTWSHYVYILPHNMSGLAFYGNSFVTRISLPSQSFLVFLMWLPGSSFSFNGCFFSRLISEVFDAFGYARFSL